MAATKQKRKKELDLISYDELLGSSSMTGLVSFLDIRPNHAQAAVVLVPRAIEVLPELIERSTGEASVGETPTVVVTPTAGQSINELSDPSQPLISDRSGELTGGLSPTVGETPTVVVTPTAGLLINKLEEDPSQRLFSDRSGELTGGLSPTVGETPTVGVPPTLSQSSNGLEQAQNQPLASDASAQSTEGLSPTVGGTPPVSSATWYSISGGRGYEAKRVQRVAVAQQSMSLGEERVYQAIWHARPIDGITLINRRLKTFALGYDKLARLTRLNEKSIRDIIPKLIEKKILEIVRKEDSWSRTGRTYHIYSYEEILERQRAADLCYIVKNGRAVEFVRPMMGEPPTVGASPTVPVRPTVTVGRTGSGTVGHTTTPLVIDRQTTSQTSSVVREALSHYTPVDDAAIRRIVNACRTHAPDCTESEIAHFVHEKSVLVTMRGSTIKNPMGHFITAVPACFEGETFRLYRESQESQVPTCLLCGGSGRTLRKLPMDDGEWGAVKAVLAQKLSAGGYRNWIEETFHGGLIDGKLEVCVANETTTKWIQEEYGELIWEIIKSLELPVATLRFKVLSEAERYEQCPACRTH